MVLGSPLPVCRFCSSGPPAGPFGIEKRPSGRAGTLRHGHIAQESRCFAREVGLEPLATPIESPDSNGMAGPSYAP